MISIHVLLYGDYTELAQRCLNSISPILLPGRISDVRIGLNGVSQGPRDVVRDWLAQIPSPIGWKVFDPGKNVWKYPLMRRMFHHEKMPAVSGASVYPPPPLTMWFDDDSHLLISAAKAEEWINRVEQEFQPVDVGMLGEVWYKNLLTGQEEWVKSRPWYTGRSISSQTQFATGGWWVIRTNILRKFDWPDELIRHNGGDTALGQLMVQQRYRIVDVRGRRWVKVNDANRRGENQPPAGVGFNRRDEADLAHHEFTCHVYSNGEDFS